MRLPLCIRVNTAGLCALLGTGSFTRLALGWRLGTCLVNSFPSLMGNLPQPTQAERCAETMCAKQVVYAEHLFSSWKSGISGHTWQRRRRTHSLDSECLMSVPGTQRLACAVTFAPGGFQLLLCDSTGKLAPGFLQILLLFFFIDLALYLVLAVSFTH